MKPNALKLDQTLEKHIQNLIHDLKIIYKNNLSEIILYGSYARGTQTDESDVDIALLVYEKPDKNITDEMIDCVASYELKCGKVLSVIDIELTKLDKWKDTLPFYKNIQRDGILLWKA